MTFNIDQFGNGQDDDHYPEEKNIVNKEPEIFIKCVVAMKGGNNATMADLEQLSDAMIDLMESFGMEMDGSWYLIKINADGYEEAVSTEQVIAWPASRSRGEAGGG